MNSWIQNPAALLWYPHNAITAANTCNSDTSSLPVTGTPPQHQVADEAAKDYEVERHALFFSDTGAKELYKDYVRFIINRRNSRTGQLYREDPTILAWDLINEPRCETWKVNADSHLESGGCV